MGGNSHYMIGASVSHSSGAGGRGEGDGTVSSPRS